jgi:hypothetical protein
MGSELQRIKRRKASILKMSALQEQASTSLIIHYSCESFYDRTDGRTPRITSIAVRNLSSGQTDSFSIHQIAEEHQIPFDKIDKKYDCLEKTMLERFFNFVTSHQHFYWIHWNMRDVNYGFSAIEHRFRVLGGTPIQITEDRKFDLARALVDLYGATYISHPRLEKLSEKNKISMRDFLLGKDEATAFDNKEFVKLHQSTLRKTDVLANIFELTSSNKLETNSSWFQQHGYTLAALIERLKEHWIISAFSICGIILTLIVKGYEFYKFFRALLDN